MKEKDVLITEERKMYFTSITIIAVCLVLLFFINLNFSYNGLITGMVVVEEAKNIELNITQEQALNAVLQAEKDMKDMIDAGFNVIWVNDTLIEAKRHFQGGNYTSLLKEIEKLNITENEKIKLLSAKIQELKPVNYSLVLEKTNEISKRREKSYEINDNINALELRISELNKSGLLTKDILDLFNSLKNEFKNERYENAEELIKKINDKMAERSAETALLTTIYAAGKDNLINFIRENYIIIIIVLIILSIAALFSYNKLMIKIF